MLLVVPFPPLYSPPPCTTPPTHIPLPPAFSSCPGVIHISSLAAPFPIPYFTSPWLFCKYLFLLLNPFTSPPISATPSSHLATIKNPLHIHDSVSVLVCLVSFLDSTVDRYVFITILLFIVLNFFFFLNKSL